MRVWRSDCSTETSSLERTFPTESKLKEQLKKKKKCKRSHYLLSADGKSKFLEFHRFPNPQNIISTLSARPRPRAAAEDLFKLAACEQNVSAKHFVI